MEGNDDALSRAEREIADALEDLPGLFPTTRSHSERTKIGRHLTALRHRLDMLVRLENDQGDRQTNLHRRRAERNALIWVLEKFAQDEGISQPRVPEPRRPSSQYVADRLRECEEFVHEGYTHTEPSRPGVLLHARHEDAAPLHVPLPVWFFLRGLSKANEPGDM